MPTGGDTVTAGLNAKQANRFIANKRGEETDRIGSASDARDSKVRQTSVALEILLPRLIADHALKLANHVRIWMRASGGADDVMRIANVGNPVTHGFIQRVLQGPCAARDWHNRRPEQFHSKYV